ncbi:MAG: TonB-dependent receptor [Gammaproteobacteria bacterium]|nr:TonB-dependent receptor [Gammaproteobacteria bacterium]
MFSNKLTIWAAVGFAWVFAAAISTPALAEEAGVEPDSSGVVEEIIVTARKREEALVDVPSSLTVISSEQLSAYDTEQLYELAHSVPNMYVDQTNSAKRMSIRGLGNTAVTTFLDQAVGLAVDGLSWQRTEAWELGYFDVERVEVLRGPQGSYFGRNTTAGLVNITTRGPSEEFEGSVSAGFETETEEQLYKASLSGPMSPTLGGRLALQYRDSEGWIESTDSPDWRSKQPAFEEILGRLTLVWTPSDNVSITSKTGFVDFTMVGSNVQMIECGPGLQGYMTFAQLLGVIQNVDDCMPDDRRTGSAGVPGGINGDGTDRREFDGWSQALTIEWGLGDYRLTSVTGYQDFETFAMFPASWFEARTTSALTTKEWSDFSQEVRLLSPSFDWGSFVVGAYYNRGEWGEYDLGVDFNFPVIALGLLPFASSAFKPLIHDQQSYAVFGELTWELGEDFRLTVGGRYTRDEKDVEVSQTLGPLGVANDPTHPAITAPFVGLTALTGWDTFDFRGDDDYTDFSPSVTLEWSFSDNGNAYVSYKQGFKSGGFDQGISGHGPGGPSDPPIGFSFQPEETEAIEAGLKLQLPEQGLLLSAAVFHQEFTDLQVQTYVPSELLASNLITSNAADSTSKGVEVEMMWQATDRLRINASVAYLDAAYDSFPNAPCYAFQTEAEGCNVAAQTQDLSGERLVMAPKNQASLGFAYHAPLGAGLELEIGGDFSYRSKVIVANNYQPGGVSDSLGMLNATIALKGRDDRWELRLIGRNLADEDVLIHHQSSAFPDSWIGAIVPPRRFQGQLTVNF